MKKKIGNVVTINSNPEKYVFVALCGASSPKNFHTYDLNMKLI